MLILFSPTTWTITIEVAVGLALAVTTSPLSLYFELLADSTILFFFHSNCIYFKEEKSIQYFRLFHPTFLLNQPKLLQTICNPIVSNGFRHILCGLLDGIWRIPHCHPMAYILKHFHII